jgi:hypothetical protein
VVTVVVIDKLFLEFIVGKTVIGFEVILKIYWCIGIENIYILVE